MNFRILQKQIKRQIISLNGGFQVIADLNAYHTFISSLKVNSVSIFFSLPLSPLTRAPSDPVANIRLC